MKSHMAHVQYICWSLPFDGNYQIFCVVKIKIVITIKKGISARDVF